MPPTPAKSPPTRKPVGSLGDSAVTVASYTPIDRGASVLAKRGFASEDPGVASRKKYPKPTELRTSVRDGFRLQVDERTSKRMAGIRQKGTTPERIVAEVLRRLGIRYRISNSDLPGSPDLANRRRRWAIFVHGCYWHRHAGCRLTTTPTRNREFWEAKFRRNVERDGEREADLRAMGYCVVVVWECETRASADLIERLVGLKTET